MSDYVICINNDGNPASLIVGKVYRTLSDPAVEVHHMLRVIDEDQSEPDGYLYPVADRCYLIIISDESGSATIRGSVTETSSVSVTSRPNGAL